MICRWRIMAKDTEWKLEYNDKEYWRDKVYLDKQLKCLPNSIKNEIGYLNWILVESCADLKQPISLLVKRIIKFEKNAAGKKQ